MRHRKQGLKLNRTASHRQAMFRNMVTSLLKYERIRTTDAKAKELRRWADNLITLAKRGDLHARRRAMSIVREKDVVHKLFNEAGDRFGAISGGYTRIIKLGRRPGDAAPVSIIELVSAEIKPKKKKRKKKARDTAAATPAAAAASAATSDEDEPKQAQETEKAEPQAGEAEKTEAAPAEETSTQVIEETAATVEEVAEQSTPPLKAESDTSEPDSKEEGDPEPETTK